jgi:hypothetical protein
MAWMIRHSYDNLSCLPAVYAPIVALVAEIVGATDVEANSKANVARI